MISFIIFRVLLYHARRKQIKEKDKENVEVETQKG